MPGQEALAQLRAFDVENARLSMWTLKKRKSRENRFRAQAVVVSDDLQAELKRIARDSIQQRTEVEDYGLLTLVNDTSCLHLGADETLFPVIEALVDQPPDEHQIDNADDLLGSDAYLVRMAHGDDTLYCVCRLSGEWTTKERRTRKNLVFTRAELDLAQDDVFSISKRFDFFVLNQDILVVAPKNFESLLEYKTTYINSFADLREDRGFQAAFADMVALEEFVGTNTTHLRRMAVVKERGFYNNPVYMQRLITVNQTRGWGISFDPHGKIIASAESARSIIHVLLNHRLRSELSEADFDVPSASPVGG